MTFAVIVRWPRVKWKPVASLFREEKTEEAILKSLKRSGAGKMNGTGGPISENSGESEVESQGWPSLRYQVLCLFLCSCSYLWRKLGIREAVDRTRVGGADGGFKLRHYCISRIIKFDTKQNKKPLNTYTI